MKSLRRASAAAAAAVLLGALATIPAGTAASAAPSWDAAITGSWVVLGSTLYSASYGDDEMTGAPYLHLNRVGGGWDRFTMFEQYAGFASVKAMTLISETPTYDTFLATTRGGALYTIHIPADSRFQPTVKKVRTSTWQTFETLVAERCGTQSSLLTAIDKDTGAAYLYAVGHGATVIQGLGKVPGKYQDPVSSRWVRDDAPPRNGA